MYNWNANKGEKNWIIWNSHLKPQKAGKSGRQIETKNEGSK